MIETLKGMLSKYGEDAELDISDDYGDIVVQIEYEREETDSEYSGRLKHEGNIKDSEKVRKLKLLAELKKEFGE